MKPEHIVRRLRELEQNHDVTGDVVRGEQIKAIREAVEYHFEPLIAPDESSASTLDSMLGDYGGDADAFIPREREQPQYAEFDEEVDDE